MILHHEKGLSGRRRRERAQTTRFASFGPYVSNSFFSSCFQLMFYALLRPIDVLKGRRVLEWAAATQTSPNDEFCVVWAICKYFLFFFVFFMFQLMFYTLLRSIDVLK